MLFTVFTIMLFCVTDNGIYVTSLYVLCISDTRQTGHS